MKFTSSFLVLATFVPSVFGGSLRSAYDYADDHHDRNLAGSTQTAQSIWTNFNSVGPDSTFGYDDTETYAFNPTTAATYYALSVSAPVVTCTGNTANCLATNQPPTPNITATPKFPMARADECSFWTGSALTTVSDSTYVTKNGINGGGNWKFTWTFTWTPTSLPLAKTAWDLELKTLAEELVGAKVLFNGQIAGLSAQLAAKSTGPKYSFSLLNSDTSSRVTNVTVSVDGVFQTNVSATVVNAMSTDFKDFSIGGVVGLSTLLASSGTLSILKTGDARTILNTDSFAGNNNGGSTGAALAYAQLEPTKLLLSEGVHSIMLSANIKGIDGSAGVSVSVTRDLRIQGLGNCAK